MKTLSSYLAPTICSPTYWGGIKILLTLIFDYPIWFAYVDDNANIRSSTQCKASIVYEITASLKCGYEVYFVGRVAQVDALGYRLSTEKQCIYTYIGNVLWWFLFL